MWGGLGRRSEKLEGGLGDLVGELGGGPGGQ